MAGRTPKVPPKWIAQSPEQKTKNHQHESDDENSHPAPGVEIARRASQTNSKIAPAKVVRK
jgi:hypothetical protein